MEVTWSFDAFFDLRLNQQWRRRWFERHSAHYDVSVMFSNDIKVPRGVLVIKEGFINVPTRVNSNFTELSWIYLDLYKGALGWMMYIIMVSYARHDVSNHQKLDSLINSVLRSTFAKYHISAFLALCEGNHRFPMDSPHKGHLIWKAYSCHDIIKLIKRLVHIEFWNMLIDFISNGFDYEICKTSIFTMSITFYDFVWT